MEFPWENSTKKAGITDISNADVERLKNKAKLYLNNGQI
jgi:hypothetical protein